MYRPYSRLAIAELVHLFEQNQADERVLKDLAQELDHRSTSKARALGLRVSGARTPLSGSVGIAENTNTGHESEDRGADKAEEPTCETLDDSLSPENDPPSAPSPPDEEEHGASDDEFWEQPIEADVTGDETRPQPPLTNSPEAILDAWLALEVLSPQSFNRPEDLADGDRRRVADFRGGLPWEREIEKARPKTKLYFHVVLGAIRLDGATATLLKSFGDRRPERPRTKALAALAVITVDKLGRPAGENPIAVSSFGYGYRQARNGKLETLRDWPRVEQKLVQQIKARLVTMDEEGEIQPLRFEKLNSVAEWLAGGFAIPNEQRVQPSFAIRHFQSFMAPSPPEPLLLNSFYLNDLIKAQNVVRSHTVGAALRRYLAIEAPESQIDLIQDRRVLQELVAPKRMPLARWPTNGTYSLSLLPQAAVNVAFSELGRAGLASINGPPGTGKTTLLRDVVAGVVHARAEALCEFDDPESAFSHRDQIKRNNSFLHLYELDGSLRGHELLVASSNNKAVENISKELPGIAAIDGSRAPSYFRSISDAVAGNSGTTWGLVAAVLGNAANRLTFYNAFWKDKDRGLSTYLWASQGKDVTAIETDPATGAEKRVTPSVVRLESPPRDREEALERWERARNAFRSESRKSEQRLGELQQLYDSLGLVTTLQDQIQQAESENRTLSLQWEQAKHALSAVARLTQIAEQEGDQIRQLQAAHLRSKPGFLSRVLVATEWKKWRKASEVLQGKSDRAVQKESLAQKTSNECIQAEERLRNQILVVSSTRDSAFAQLKPIEVEINAAKARLGSRFADASFWGADHKRLQALVPWFSDEIQTQRDRCFSAAFDVHRAFIEAAAKPIRNNLTVLFSVLLGSGLDGDRTKLLPSLWSTLFLVTPVISTTFASVGRMLGPMPPESIGWLLIDEAGQALPQAAVGALTRAKRSLVVGDPLQIQPVVTLSSSLTDRVCRQFGVNPEIWSAPKASVQTLADSASRFAGWLEQQSGSVKIGLPLFVHRRCAEPMFSISNAIAYAGMMVNATPERNSKVSQVLGPSRWIDVVSTSADKWCAEEGDLVVRMLQDLADAGLAEPDVFWVTPFRAVAHNLRERLAREHSLLAQFTEEPWRWLRERVGTVHTFQGKEAEAVIFVLGAQGDRQSGARQWAGSPPNLANVAVSRAKDCLYVVGNRRLWAEAGCFRELANRLRTT